MNMVLKTSNIDNSRTEERSLQSNTWCKVVMLRLTLVY